MLFNCPWFHVCTEQGAERQTCPTVDIALRLADLDKQGQYRKETSRDTVQLLQCINSSHFSFLWQTRWPAPKADGGKMTAVNYSGMLLICKSVLPWKTALFMECVDFLCWYWANDSGSHMNSFRGEKKENRPTFKPHSFCFVKAAISAFVLCNVSVEISLTYSTISEYKKI